MFDINYLMNGKKKPIKPKKHLPTLFPQSKPQNNLSLINLFKGKSHPNPTDRKTPLQKQFLKRTRFNTGKSHKRFWDSDGDGVINGLDCNWRNPNKHSSKQLLTPVQKQIIQQSVSKDELYDDIKEECSWGQCAPIAQGFYAKENKGKIISNLANWRENSKGSHVIYVDDDNQVYDPINKYKGDYDKYKEQFNVEDSVDYTEQSKPNNINKEETEDEKYN